MRQTGGMAFGATSTRSNPRSRAIWSAWNVGTIPSCWPSSSIRRTSRIRIRSLTRTGLLISAPPRQLRTLVWCCRSIDQWASTRNSGPTRSPLRLKLYHIVADSVNAWRTQQHRSFAPERLVPVQACMYNKLPSGCVVWYICHCCFMVHLPDGTVWLSR